MHSFCLRKKFSGGKQGQMLSQFKLPSSDVSWQLIAQGLAIASSFVVAYLTIWLSAKRKDRQESVRLRSALVFELTSLLNDIQSARRMSVVQLELSEGRLCDEAFPVFYFDPARIGSLHQSEAKSVYGCYETIRSLSNHTMLLSKNGGRLNDSDLDNLRSKINYCLSELRPRSDLSVEIY